MANLGNIAKREDRTIKVGPFDTAPSGSESWTYAIGFRVAASGADLATVAFGASEYNASGYWLVPVPAATSALLTVGMNYVGVWRTGTGTKTLLNAADDYVMVLDRPGNA
mgnify:CR=1 FL=1